MTTVNGGQWECPFCQHRSGVLCDAETNIPKTKPEPGDLTVCLQCSEVLEFQPDMTLAMASLSKLLQLDPQQHHQIENLQKQIRQERTVE